MNLRPSFLLHQRVYRKCWILRKKCVKENKTLCLHTANVYNDTKGLMPENKKVPVSEGLLLMEKRKTDHGYHSISRRAQHRAGCVI